MGFIEKGGYLLFTIGTYKYVLSLCVDFFVVELNILNYVSIPKPSCPAAASSSDNKPKQTTSVTPLLLSQRQLLQLIFRILNLSLVNYNAKQIFS